MKRLLQALSFLFRVCKVICAIALGLALIAVVFPEYLPVGTPRAKLTEFSPKPILDMHVHVAGFGYGGSGCFVHPSLSNSYKRHFYLHAFGVTHSELKKHGDAFLVKELNNTIRESRFIGKAVLLALDGVYNKDGLLERDKTQIFVPNTFVRDQAKKYATLEYGASINPYRRDAIEELRKAKSDGAVLLKWIPNIMHIDPSDEALIPFYKELVALDLPLLTHAGQERAFSTAIDSYGDPARLKLPLVLGVKVIAAHIATTGAIEHEEMIDRLLPLFDRYPNLYTDISSLTQINKLTYVEKGIQNKSLFARMIYGSDWPLQFFPLVTPWLHIRHLSFADIQYIAAQENVFDRDVLLKYALGVPESVFERSARFLGVEKNNVTE